MPSLTLNPDLLRALAAAGPDTPKKDIAEAAGLHPNNLQRTIENHVAQGLLEADGHTLTEQGRFYAQDPQSPPAAPQAASGLTLKRLSELEENPANYRKTYEDGAIEELAGDILKRGLLQNLLGHPSPLRNGKTRITGGNRRLKALQLLAARGDIEADYPVPVLIGSDDEADVLETAIAENRMREDVDPLVEADAIVQLQELRRQRGEDARAVTAELSEKFGQHQRVFQRAAQISKGISPAVRAAYESREFGDLLTMTWLRQLASADEALQAEALDSLRAQNWNTPRTSQQLKDWLDKRMPPVGQQVFTLEDYEAKGGFYTDPQEEGEPRRFACRALADKLTQSRIDALTKTLKTAHAYSFAQTERVWHSWKWHKVGANDDVPAKDCGVVFVVDADTLKVDVVHPVMARDAFDKLTEQRAKAEAKADAGEDEAAKPISAKQWERGSLARTNMIRRTLQKPSSASMAVTFMMLLQHGGGLMVSAVSVVEPSGGFGHALDRLLEARPCPGIEKVALRDWQSDSAEDWRVTDPATALPALLDRSDLQDLLAARTADLATDAVWRAAQASAEDAYTLFELGLVRETGSSVMSVDHASGYTKAQQLALVDAHGLPLDTDALEAMKKADADKAFAAAWPDGLTPIEARFLTQKEAARLANKAMKGEKI